MAYDKNSIDAIAERESMALKRASKPKFDNTQSYNRKRLMIDYNQNKFNKLFKK